MRRIITIIIFGVLAVSTSFAQTQTQAGNFLFEVGTSPVGDAALYKGASTGFGLISTDGTTLWAVGAEGGYFASDDLALKVGLGYTDFDGRSFFTYKVGAKYYAGGNVPFQIDITGASQEDVESAFGDFDVPDPLWLGLQAGYAIFLNDFVSLEPALRYNISLNSDYTDEGIFEARIGFVVFL